MYSFIWNMKTFVTKINIVINQTKQFLLFLQKQICFSLTTFINRLSTIFTLLTKQKTVQASGNDSVSKLTQKYTFFSMSTYKYFIKIDWYTDFYTINILQCTWVNCDDCRKKKNIIINMTQLWRLNSASKIKNKIKKWD